LQLDDQRHCRHSRFAWARFCQLKDKVQVRTGHVVPIIVIQEAGLDGFWIHRLLQDEQLRILGTSASPS